ncbi:papain-like cysteine peptidase [Paenibacillus sp. JCM 10914]|uniref:DUF1796 family putative cysteine peptidase n=1 Tax=Paenibacillus sp. JCM 10914 TaxID=1236974 RepID=UPI0003CCA444|nr:DUF1796 family putative cysteine peptidase [Paenibacillus sp. JCM 10914]GAE07461.1 hypothetical protein JCM10914_3691 [Paenibacillus sp. JCM 10914]
MELLNIKRAYDVIIGLGSWCGPSIYLRQHQLRRFSFPLDWMISNSLPDVTRLISNHFDGFMDLERIKKIDGTSAYLEDGIASPNQAGQAHDDAHFILDTWYNVISVHDFPVRPNRDWTETYDSYKAKLQERIRRFYDVLKNSSSVLFVRWGPVNPQEAVELHAALSPFVSGTCNVLFMQPIEGMTYVQEIDWGFDGISTLQVPLDRPNDLNVWNYAYLGLRLTGHWS